MKNIALFGMLQKFDNKVISQAGSEVNDLPNLKSLVTYFNSSLFFQLESYPTTWKTHSTVLPEALFSTILPRGGQQTKKCQAKATTVKLFSRKVFAVSG